MVKITYIWHDCFVVETDTANLVFDYWLDVDGLESARPAFLERLDRTKPLLVLVSHFHKDHYNPAVFGWAAFFTKIHYVVSRDVWKRMRHMASPTSVYKGLRVDPALVAVVPVGESFSFGGVRVTAFPSTDVGNSYLVEVGGRRIFHAGDLNAWLWRDESTEDEIRKALGDYHACLRSIDSWMEAEGISSPGQRDGDNDREEARPRAVTASHHRAVTLGGSNNDSLYAIDVCFFPVDSRIGSGYWEGAAEFVRRFDVHRFFPMHFALGDADERRRHTCDALRIDLYANPARGQYIPLALSGSTYIDAAF